MEIRFYTPEMDHLGVIENQTSLTWTRRYFEPGEFELHAPITETNLKWIARGNLIWKKGSKEAGIIEDRQLEESSNKQEIVAKGRFLSAYMDRRVILGVTVFNGTVEEAMQLLLNSVTEIPRVELGELKGFEDTVNFQVSNKNLLTYMEKLGKSAGIGFRFRPDFNKKKIYFETYKGKERGEGQTRTNRVIFSAAYANLNNAVYRENDQLYKNVAYVGGEGEGNERTIIEVGTGSGLERREVFVDARDLNSEGLTSAEYEAKLKQRGLEALNEDAISSSLECETNASANFVYKTDYDLGDVVTIKKESWGIREDKRITEVQEIYEYGGMKVSPTFGTALPETIDWSDD